ncbi:putative P-loop ATPase/GTPase [Halohasta litchfieldiae]|jgi:predicted P-loop ATPase/GTPase|uniref:Predicted P-loop ATPase/GTPase n=1 Tax=Halohasta litchfieldiae TaxID=1073996 RepID=A0A1H6VTQ8_9EURY|nr:ATPase [Halohasta litchfieldiae]ATW89403.1 putative P-loop ATPase/GTPase [Halohasta litchfieldiae]SEJ05227.1 Predicted P-loop ATPase/GTPase [Halohasta litchfieldiae]
MKLLVAGDARVDAGKTTFAAGLLASLSDAVGFKPRAGNDYWFDHDDVVSAVNGGRLYGKDIATLTAAAVDSSDRELNEEQLNPVHRLWRPTPDRTGLLGEQGRTFLVDRVTTPEGPWFVVNGTAEDAGLLPDHLIEALPLDGAPRVRSVDGFNELMTNRYLPAFERVTDRITETEPAVVESYSDIALPVDGIEFDAVAVVGPTRAKIYDGQRYLKACAVASGSAREGQLEERVDRVVEMIEPLSTHDLQPLTGAERADPKRVASQYEPVYEALLEVALK